MELYLLRHGIAEERSSTGRDADRRLTDEGRDKLRRVLERAHGAGVDPALIISSPLKRALETAEIAAHQLGYEGRIVRAEGLTPGSTPAKLWTEVRAHAEQPSILLAGHEPLFSSAVAWMLGSTRPMVNFKKAAIVRIDFETMGAEPRGVLQWMLTPKLVS